MDHTGQMGFSIREQQVRNSARAWENHGGGTEEAYENSAWDEIQGGRFVCVSSEDRGLGTQTQRS